MSILKIWSAGRMAGAADGAGRTPQLPGAAVLLPCAGSGSRPRAASQSFTPSTSPRASSSTTRLRSASGRSMSDSRQQRHALRPGAEERFLHPLRLRPGDHAHGSPLQDVRDPVEEDDAAPSWRDLGVQREGHDLRELRHVQPGGQLAAACSVVGPESLRHAQQLLRPERRVDRNRPARHRLQESCSFRI